MVNKTNQRFAVCAVTLSLPDLHNIVKEITASTVLIHNKMNQPISSQNGASSVK